ncbi:lipopolysaccharide biosynthesis protein [Croceicoccus sp. Ery5]|uniref:lipopolysaccharide biosynthesis protein n=1 Tax=Croceicoccus sp. Ery5 TaxID=1703340 RepID=UPI001E5E72C0|nr:oligosaccharide flippase family protein [Croceicoccus sp. Ery5]
MGLGVLRSRLAREAGIYLFGTVLNRIFPFLLLPIYTRAMSPAEFGKWGFAMAILQALFIVGDLGLNSATTRLYYEKQGAGDQSDFLLISFITRIATVVGVGLLLAPLLTLFWGAISGHQLALMPFMPLLVGCMVTQSIVSFNLASARATRDPKQYIRVQIAQALMQAVGSAYLVLTGWGAVGPLLGFFIGGALTALFVCVSFVRERKPQDALDWEEPRRLLSYGIKSVPTAATLWLKRLADRVIIGRMLTMVDLAIYQVAATGIAPLAILLGSFNSAYLPFFFEQRKKANPDLRRLADLDLAMVAALAIIVTVTMMLGPELVRILAPISYRSAATLIPPLVLTAFLGGAALQFNKEILFHKRPGIVSTVTTVPAIIAVVGNIFLIPHYGIATAAWAGVAASALTVIGSIIAMRQLEHTPHRFGLIFAICFVTTVAALIFTVMADMPPFRAMSLAYRSGAGLLLIAGVLALASPSLVSVASIKRKPARGA